jgi:4-hydroxy-tetrahydrodipicolinate synthase
MDLFSGLSAFPITPFDTSGDLDTAAFSRLLQRIETAGADSVGLLGSTGGYAYLSREERKRATECAVACVGGKIPLIVGVGALRTDAAQALAQDAKTAGADGLLLAPMSYTPLTEEEVYEHFVAVAGATDLPLCIYNNPGTTKFTFSETLLERLSGVANIAAVKMPLPADMDFKGEIGRLRSKTRAGFKIGYSGDWGAADALLAGCDAWYSVIGGLLPEPALKLVRAGRSGDAVEVQRMNDRFQPLWALFKELSSLRVVYAAANILSLSLATPPRPILPLTAPDQDRVEQALARLLA